MCSPSSTVQHPDKALWEPPNAGLAFPTVASLSNRSTKKGHLKKGALSYKVRQVGYDSLVRQNQGRESDKASRATGVISPETVSLTARTLCRKLGGRVHLAQPDSLSHRSQLLSACQSVATILLLPFGKGPTM